MSYPYMRVKVWGEYACFTRPETKVERVSYDAMTPSAARGVLEAIFWKPEMQYEVRAIKVLKPIRHFSMVRNEVSSKAVISSTRRWAETREGFFADENRVQRHTLALRDVAYIIEADIRLLPHVQAHEAKYRDQFRRRVAHGRCYSRPYLGCREFAAHFAEESNEDEPIELNAQLGRMLFDMHYQQDTSGQGTPTFFDAELHRGVLTVPEHLYEMRRRG